MNTVGSSIWIDLMIVLFLIVLNGIFAMTEIALISSKPSKLEVEANRGKRSAHGMTRILVVEDDTDLQFLYSKALTRQGHDVTTARNTGEAIVYLTSDDFDAMILDINMPDAPGTKVLEFKQSDVRLRDLPVLVISANEKYQTETLALGARHFMVKPVSLQDLTAAIKNVLPAE